MPRARIFSLKPVFTVNSSVESRSAESIAILSGRTTTIIIVDNSKYKEIHNFILPFGGSDGVSRRAGSRAGDGTR